MLIVTQNERAVWNCDDMQRLHITSKNTQINLIAKNGSGGEVASYRSLETCIAAMQDFVAACEAGATSYRFLTEDEFNKRRSMR